MDILIKGFIFLFGASVGSFLNVLIDRPIKGRSILGRSQCDFCKKKLVWYDLIPILSFFLIKGRCRYCHRKLSWQYPLVELFTGILFILIFVTCQYKSCFNFQFSIFKLIILWGIISCFVVIFVSDFKYHLIADGILWALFVFVVLFHLSNNLFSIEKWSYFLVSGLIVCLPIFLIYFLSHERAMGLGDVYLSAIIGFFLGWQKGFLALYIAILTGAIFGLTLILLKRKKLKSKVAFGPFIFIGTIIMLFWGERILEMIRRAYGW